MRVFCDTNTLLSAALFPSGRVAAVFTLLIEHEHEVVTSDYVLDEVRAVVERKFATKVEAAELFVAIFDTNGLTVATPRDAASGETKVRDAKDRPVLRGARAANADVLLTGDHDLLEAGIEIPEIINAATLLERLTST